MKQYNEQDILKAIAGSYQPGFFQIKLSQPFNGGIDRFSQKELGTFLHEYVHFLQNISTPWGLYRSMVQYQALAKTFAFIQESSHEIELPLRICDAELDRKWRIIKLGSGYYPFSGEDEHICRKIDRSKDIVIHRTKEQIGSNQFPQITLDVFFQDSTMRSIELGAVIINESMAAMYQMMVDPTATHENNDLPYNLVQILCEKHFPNIAGDRRKLISICYISLFSMSPAEVLLDQLDYANEHPSVSGEALFVEFVTNSKIKSSDGVTVSVEFLMDRLINVFKELLKKILDVELDYIEYVLEQVRVSKHMIPLLSVIHQEELTSALVESMVNVLGVPFTYNEDGRLFFPKSIKDPTRDSKDVMRLIQYGALFQHITSPNPFYCCPLKPLCIKSVPPIEKDECFDFPWEGKECPITSLAEYIGMKSKLFKWIYNKGVSVSSTQS